MRDLGDRLEIYLADFDEVKQKYILRFLGLESGEEANLDRFAICEIPKPEGC